MGKTNQVNCATDDTEYDHQSAHGRGRFKFTDEQLFLFITNFLSENDQIPPYGLIAKYFNVALNAVTERIISLEKKGHFERNELGKIKLARTNGNKNEKLVRINCGLNSEHKKRARIFEIRDSRICDNDMIHYMHDFLVNNDQLPTSANIANHFNVTNNAVVLRLKRLQKHGIFDKNAVNKLMFNRVYLDSIKI